MAESAADRDKFAEADLEFHQLIGVASGNPMMRSLAAVIEAALYASFTQNSPVDDDGDLEETAASHGAVVDAIASGNPARSRAALVAVISLGQALLPLRGLLMPVLLPLVACRWLVLKSSRQPVWPQQILDESVIDAEDPHRWPEPQYIGQFD
jgi:hypothetical protein